MADETDRGRFRDCDTDPLSQAVDTVQVEDKEDERDHDTTQDCGMDRRDESGVDRSDCTSHTDGGGRCCMDCCYCSGDRSGCMDPFVGQDLPGRCRDTQTA